MERLEGISSALGAILAENVALTCMEVAWKLHVGQSQRMLALVFCVADGRGFGCLYLPEGAHPSLALLTDKTVMAATTAT